jgi:uncharacterized membrane protein HdeD (DUF308 family)
MDLHALGQGRSALVLRGVIAFLFGVVASNMPEGVTPDKLVTLLGVWALAEGAATVRQALPRTGTTGRVERQPAVLAVGGLAVLVGTLAVLGLGLSSTALIWLLAGWLTVRAAAELVAGFTAGPRRTRVLMGLAALVDLGIVAVLALHSTGSVVDAAMYAGVLIAAWGALMLGLGLATKAVLVFTPEGPRLLSPR